MKGNSEYIQLTARPDGSLYGENSRNGFHKGLRAKAIAAPGKTKPLPENSST